MQGNEKQQLAAFCAAKLSSLFSKQWSMPPLSTEQFLFFYFFYSGGMSSLFAE
jgi:hypothetical protein